MSVSDHQPEALSGEPAAPETSDRIGRAESRGVPKGADETGLAVPLIPVHVGIAAVDRTGPESTRRRHQPRSLSGVNRMTAV